MKVILMRRPRADGWWEVTGYLLNEKQYVPCTVPNFSGTRTWFLTGHRPVHSLGISDPYYVASAQGSFLGSFKSLSVRKQPYC